MNKKKEDLFFINTEDLVPDVDFEVVTDTPFDSDLVKHFFEFENHDIDVDLALMLGLGVVKNLHI